MCAGLACQSTAASHAGQKLSQSTCASIWWLVHVPRARVGPSQGPIAAKIPAYGARSRLALASIQPIGFSLSRQAEVSWFSCIKCGGGKA